ncbi:hypothetical protein EUX98_g8297 [Antrodiella citrinella]|uniref:Uncharacterized protein n=1 Tax=Antrodiella citrinella TaxID=2447956 RepID=A0A4S4MEY3_9APHY|nr:hypothetical protein EUX98_g8297 [Antrodiella citrinella]
MSVTNLPRIRTESGSNDTQPRALSCFPSASSATFFFGPSIPQPGKEGDTLASSTSGNAHLGVLSYERPATTSRHSCGGSPSLLPGTSSHDSEDEFLMSNGPPDTSFTFSVAGSTPSPQKPHREEVSPLPNEFTRDSGIALESGSSVDCCQYCYCQMFIAGHYEYRNKGVDMFIESLACAYPLLVIVDD